MEFGRLGETGNYVVLSTVCILWALYIVGLVLVRKADKKDRSKVAQEGSCATCSKRYLLLFLLLLPSPFSLLPAPYPPSNFPLLLLCSSSSFSFYLLLSLFFLLLLLLSFFPYSSSAAPPSFPAPSSSPSPPPSRSLLPFLLLLLLLLILFFYRCFRLSSKCSPLKEMVSIAIRYPLKQECGLAVEQQLM